MDEGSARRRSSLRKGFVKILNAKKVKLHKFWFQYKIPPRRITLGDSDAINVINKVSLKVWEGGAMPRGVGGEKNIFSIRWRLIRDQFRI